LKGGKTKKVVQDFGTEIFGESEPKMSRQSRAYLTTEISGEGPVAPLMTPGGSSISPNKTLRKTVQNLRSVSPNSSTAMSSLPTIESPLVIKKPLSSLESDDLGVKRGSRRFYSNITNPSKYSKEMLNTDQNVTSRIISSPSLKDDLLRSLRNQIKKDRKEKTTSTLESLADDTLAGKLSPLRRSGDFGALINNFNYNHTSPDQPQHKRKPSDFTQSHTQRFFKDKSSIQTSKRPSQLTVGSQPESAKLLKDISGSIDSGRIAIWDASQKSIFRPSKRLTTFNEV